jgi:hypothetical protein
MGQRKFAYGVNSAFAKDVKNLASYLSAFPEDYKLISINLDTNIMAYVVVFEHESLGDNELKAGTLIPDNSSFEIHDGDKVFKPDYQRLFDWEKKA